MPYQKDCPFFMKTSALENVQLDTSLVVSMVLASSATNLA